MFSSITIKSKTFWAGIVSIVTGIGLIVTGDVNTGITTIVLGILAVFGRDAVAKVQEKTLRL